MDSVRKRAIVSVCALLSLSASPSMGQGGTPRPAVRETSEYEVKAAYLINFARFVDWPAVADGGPQNPPVAICILGDDLFEGALERLARGEAVNGRSIVIRRVGHWEESCQILFVTRFQRDLFRILRQAGPGVLTVGEDPAFLREGGMINLVIDNRRVRFDVNLKAAEEASVRISSRLLTVARTVQR